MHFGDSARMVGAKNIHSSSGWAVTISALTPSTASPPSPCKLRTSVEAPLSDFTDASLALNHQRTRAHAVHTTTAAQRIMARWGRG